MLPIHIYTPFGDGVRSFFEAALPSREIIIISDEDEFRAALPDMTYLLAFQPPQGLWPTATKLKLLQGFGAGIDHLLPFDGLAESVTVANGAGLSVDAMSEFTLGMVIMMRKQMHQAYMLQKADDWARYVPLTLSGATLGILGLGRIGFGLAEKASALGMRVIGTQRSPRETAGVEAVFGSDETEKVMAQSDVIACFLPLTDETKGFIDRDLIFAMKPGSTFVNVGRGGVVDEAAIAEALTSGHLSGAAFDVFEEEPLPAEHPLRKAPNLIITPHVAGTFPDFLPKLAELYAENIRLLESGAPAATAIRRELGY